MNFLKKEALHEGSLFFSETLHYYSEILKPRMSKILKLEMTLLSSIDDDGIGVLTDNGDVPGHWEFTTPAYVDFNGVHPLTDLTQSTSNTVTHREVCRL